MLQRSENIPGSRNGNVRVDEMEKKSQNSRRNGNKLNRNKPRKRTKNTGGGSMMISEGVRFDKITVLILCIWIDRP